MPYEFYKVLHVFSLFIFFSCLSLSYFCQNVSKRTKILQGVFSLLILVAGMGLLARMGFQHGAGFPLWVWAKMAIWLVLAAAGPILAKRLTPKLRPYTYVVLMLLSFVAIALAVLKPH